MVSSAMARIAITKTDPAEAVVEWFGYLGRLCAAVDYESARWLFAPDVVSFGTRAELVHGLDRLEEEQWRGIWPNITDFKIDQSSIESGGHADLAWGVALWTSTGYAESGEAFHRPGRATVILERRGTVWLAIHSHFSIKPGTPPKTFGRATTSPPLARCDE
ncbi:MAG: nuclear transport factor 2 family protein [Chloroflexi bacterium]|nr:nuclear transport factor 2 family protein [Chloroflexota bacterium]